MKASSESGECASLISTGDFSVFEAVCRAAMGWVFLVLSLASFFPERRSAPERCRRETIGKGRAHRWGLRGAGPDDFCNAKPSILATGGQTAGWIVRKELHFRIHRGEAGRGKKRGPPGQGRPYAVPAAESG